jgi:hypothetical protein
MLTIPIFSPLVINLEIGSKWFDVIIVRMLEGGSISPPVGQNILVMKWMGEEGTCPVCHSSLLTVTGKNPVECPICGIAGTLKVEGDRISVHFSEDEKKRSRLFLAGKTEHWVEIRTNVGMFMQRPDAYEIPERVKQYEPYGVPVLTPPRKNGKGPAATQ